MKIKNEKNARHTEGLEEHFGVGARYYHPDNDPKKPMKGLVQLWPAFSQKCEPVEIPIKLALAAPELLEAAKGVLEWLELALPKFNGPLDVGNGTHQIALRAAIAKATGQEGK